MKRLKLCTLPLLVLFLLAAPMGGQCIDVIYGDAGCSVDGSCYVSAQIYGCGGSLDGYYCDISLTWTTSGLDTSGSFQVSCY